MEKNNELVEPGCLEPASRLSFSGSDTQNHSAKEMDGNSKSSLPLSGGSISSSTVPLTPANSSFRKGGEQNCDANDAESLTDKLIQTVLYGCGKATKGEEEEDDEDFLSASDGESDDEKIQEWGDSLSEPADSNNAANSTHSDTHAFSSNAKSDTERDVFESGIQSEKPEDCSDQGSTASVENNKKEMGGGDNREKNDLDGEKKEKERREKEEEEKLQKRQEFEDTLTEDERQSRLAEAVKVKTAGNEAFKASLFDEAFKRYSEGLDLCPLKYVQQRSIMLSNRAACNMKQENWEEALSDCNKAIDLQPTYIKAINRRADSYEKLEKLEEALKDHQKILELDRSQANSYHASVRLDKEIKERNEKMKDEMMGKLKDLGNMVLRPFGLSTNNFQLNQDANSGGYSVQFVQNPPTNGNGK